MTRDDFVRGYAERSGLSAECGRVRGLIEIGDRVMLALPCGNCGDDECGGWAMVSAGSVLDHLFLYAPDALRDAYRDAVSTAEGAVQNDAQTKG